MLRSLLDSAAKRGLDIALAGTGLALTLPAMTALAVVIAMEDGDSPFFIQERVGRDGKPFFLIKFRTMSNRDLPADGRQITVGEDPRITRIGRLLRGSRLDELPQLVNILIGDMSLVGPRPEVPRYVQHYSEDELRVLTVRPGLTDPATLAYRNEAERLAASDDPETTYIDEVMREKLALNLDYLERRDAISDLGVLLQTVTTLIADRLEDRSS